MTNINWNEKNVKIDFAAVAQTTTKFVYMICLHDEIALKISLLGRAVLMVTFNDFPSMLRLVVINNDGRKGNFLLN